MKKKPTTLSSFEQLGEVMKPQVGDIYQKKVQPTVGNPTGIEEYRITDIAETKRVSLLAKNKRRY